MFLAKNWRVKVVADILDEKQARIHGLTSRNLLVGIYDDFWFLVNFQLFLYKNDQIFKTNLYLRILDVFDMIQQQEQAYVLG